MNAEDLNQRDFLLVYWRLRAVRGKPPVFSGFAPAEIEALW
jgi:hypothetical protein